MDREAELIRSERWSELKRLYSQKVGYSWELAWIHLLQMEDSKAAIRYFDKALRDPNFEQAAYIMLWKLGAKPASRRALGPGSLRLYNAYLEGELRPLAYFLMSSPAHFEHLECLLARVLEVSKSVSPDELYAFKRIGSLSTEASFYLGLLWDSKLRHSNEAQPYYESFLQDAWTKKLVEESRRLIFDQDLSKRLRFAYAQRDGLSLKRLFRAVLAKIEKLEEASVSRVWKEGLKAAVELDQKLITEHLLGYSFWKAYELSPQALFKLRSHVFPRKEHALPDFVQLWNVFFSGEELEHLPIELEPDSKPLWQIKVELDPSALSEALVRFPSDERFLFLWSLRANTEKPSARPESFKESSVVRDNLKRAFSRSTNKLLWFDRLRKGGCSQDFYEYVLGEIRVPIEWILEDLDSGRLSNSSAIRTQLRDQLSTVDHQSEDFSVEEIQKSLAHLSPGEIQHVLLTRYVLKPIPTSLLNDEYLDLFWEAKDRVGTQVFSAWVRAIANYLEGLKTSFKKRHWLWAQEAWKLDSKFLERLSPSANSGEEFPWDEYLKAAEAHGEHNLLLTSLLLMSNDRLRVEWIDRLLPKTSDYRLKQAIERVQAPHLKSRLLGQWFDLRQDPHQAIQALLEEYEQTPILSEQPALISKIISRIAKLPIRMKEQHSSLVAELASDMNRMGGTEPRFFRQVAEIMQSLGDYEEAWRWALLSWAYADTAVKEELFDEFKETAFNARATEEAQRILVQTLFERNSADSLGEKILNELMDSESVFRVKHVRREFVERVGRLYPLHPDVLKARTDFDLRAVIVWDAFYGEPLESPSYAQPAEAKKRKFELWGLTETMKIVESGRSFTRYLNSLPLDKNEKEMLHPYLETARRSFSRLSKKYKVKSKAKLLVKADLGMPFRLNLEEPAIEFDVEFFKELDEEILTAICVGFMQVHSDQKLGLFDFQRLMERFFQGCLISGASFAKVVRLLVWMAMHEKLIEPRLLRDAPERFSKELPLLNTMIGFYFSDEYLRKVKECGVQLL